MGECSTSVLHGSQSFYLTTKEKLFPSSRIDRSHHWDTLREAVDIRESEVVSLLSLEEIKQRLGVLDMR